MSSRSPAAARPRRCCARKLARHARLNIEADSLNAAVLGPDVDLDERGRQPVPRRRRARHDAEDRPEVHGDPPRARARATSSPTCCDAMQERLAPLVDRQSGARRRPHGPARDRAAARRRRAPASRGSPRRPRACTAAPARSRRSASPTARASSSGRSCGSTKTPMTCAPLNEHEVFGPVVDGRRRTPAMPAFAAAFIARGEGCLVSSAYSDDRDWVARLRRRSGAVGRPAVPRLVEDGRAIAGARHGAAVARPRRPRSRRRRRGARRRARARTSTCSAARSRATRAC